MVQRSEVELETWAVMAGRGAPGAGAPLNVPPVLASNFALGSRRAYSRDDATPTWEAFEELLGGLEGGQAVAFASGMGAAAAIFDVLPVGATVVVGDDCYQGVLGLAAAGAAHGRWRVIRADVEDTPPDGRRGGGWTRSALPTHLLPVRRRCRRHRGRTLRCSSGGTHGSAGSATTR